MEAVVVVVGDLLALRRRRARGWPGTSRARRRPGTGSARGRWRRRPGAAPGGPRTEAVHVAGRDLLPLARPDARIGELGRRCAGRSPCARLRRPRRSWRRSAAVPRGPRSAGGRRLCENSGSWPTQKAKGSTARRRFEPQLRRPGSASGAIVTSSVTVSAIAGLVGLPHRVAMWAAISAISCCSCSGCRCVVWSGLQLVAKLLRLARLVPGGLSEADGVRVRMPRAGEDERRSTPRGTARRRRPGSVPCWPPAG